MLSSSIGTDSMCALSTSIVSGWLFEAATTQTVLIRKNAKKTVSYRDILNVTSCLSRFSCALSGVEVGALTADPVRCRSAPGKEGAGAVPHSSLFDGCASLMDWQPPLEQNLPLCVNRNLLLTRFHRDGIAPRIIYGSDSVSGI